MELSSPWIKWDILFKALTMQKTRLFLSRLAKRFSDLPFSSIINVDRCSLYTIRYSMLILMCYMVLSTSICACFLIPLSSLAVFLYSRISNSRISFIVLYFCSWARVYAPSSCTRSLVILVIMSRIYTSSMMHVRILYRLV